MTRDRLRAGVPRLALAILPVAAAGCYDTPPPTDPEVSHQAVAGEWAYRAPEVRLEGSAGDAPCEITGVVIELKQLSHKGRRVGTLEGRTRGGTLTCRGNLAPLSGPIESYPIGNAHTFNQYVSFNFGTADWRHDGIVDAAADSMGGIFVLRNGALRLEGTFVARRARR